MTFQVTMEDSMMDHTEVARTVGDQTTTEKVTQRKEDTPIILTIR